MRGTLRQEIVTSPRVVRQWSYEHRYYVGGIPALPHMSWIEERTDGRFVVEHESGIELSLPSLDEVTTELDRRYAVRR